MMRRRFQFVPVAMVALSGVTLASCSMEMDEVATDDFVVEDSESLTLDQRIAGCQQDPRVLARVVSLDVCVGADLFFRESFNGNGRSCATCHRVENNFTIDPPFIATLPANDPLFIAEFTPALANLERPAQMRGSSLILENADGFAPDPNVRFVLRSVPHNFSMGTSVTRNATADPVSPPQHRTGWSGDGAPGNGQLRDFQTGAIIQHYPKRLNRVAGTDFRLATSGELDRIDLFMRRLGRTNEHNISVMRMSDAGAESGRGVFIGAGRCNGCHANAGANASFGGGGNRNFNTGVEAARRSSLASFPRDGGFLGGPANPDGSFGNGTFNTPPLVEAADTPPFFHTDTTVSGASAHNATVANTIEQAVAFYDTPAFNASPAAAAGQINLDATQINNVGRFLRVINADFNARLAIKRLDAALELVNHFQNNHLTIQRRTLQLALVEVDDALQVLNGQANLNNSSRTLFTASRGFINTAISTTNSVTRQSNISQARSRVFNGANSLASGLNLIIDEGTNMF